MNSLSLYHYFHALHSNKPANRIPHYTPFGATRLNTVWTNTKKDTNNV